MAKRQYWDQLGAVQILPNHLRGGFGGGVKPNYYNLLQFVEGGGGGEVLHYSNGGKVVT